MRCPECGNSSRVLDSKKYEKAVYRKRECKTCRFRYWTEELEIDIDSDALKGMRAEYRKKKKSRKMTLTS